MTHLISLEAFEDAIFKGVSLLAIATGTDSASGYNSYSQSGFMSEEVVDARRKFPGITAEKHAKISVAFFATV